MLMGHTDGLSELRSPKHQLLSDPESEVDDDDSRDCPEKVLFSASFEELASNSIKYDTVIWLSISLLLVLAWGVGIIMLLYLPIKRYVLQKDISSRKLYVTPSEIVYKVNQFVGRALLFFLKRRITIEVIFHEVFIHIIFHLSL